MVAILLSADETPVALYRAFLIALVVEIVLIGAAVGWLSMRSPAPLSQSAQPLRLQLVELLPTTPQPEIQAPPPPPEPKPQLKPKTAETPVPRPLPKVIPKPLPQVVAVVPPTIVPQDAPPAPAAASTVEPQQISPPAPVNSSHDITADYESKVRAAIQSALGYPVAAKALGREGRVQVSFDFNDGQISKIRIVNSGDLEAFDHAAEVAVQTANYPTSPAELRHQTLHFLIWVEFLKKR
jgi:protein TonB